MMLHKLKFVVFLITAGMLAGCGASDPYVKDAKENLQNQNFEALLESANQAIENPPDNGLGYYYKGVALGELARQNPPANRVEDYEKALEAFNRAEEIFASLEEAPEEAERIPTLKNVFWRDEHNSAVEIVTNDSLKQVKGLGTAVDHLKNATSIIPDSVLSWEVLAEVEVMNDNIQGGIDAMTRAIEMLDKPEPNKFRRLALFHRNQQSPEKAIEILEQGQQLYPENIEITQDLTDAYLQADRIDKGISTIQALIDTDPENPKYRLVYGTAVYQTVLGMNTDLSQKYDKISELKRELDGLDADSEEAADLKSQISELEEEASVQQEEINKLTSGAINALEKVIEMTPKNFEALNTLGIIYQNKAAALIEKRNNTRDNEEAAKYDTRASENLREAMVYYEKASELQPDNQDVWRSLFQIYTALGMEDKAKDAADKAGI